MTVFRKKREKFEFLEVRLSQSRLGLASLGYLKYWLPILEILAFEITVSYQTNASREKQMIIDNDKNALKQAF
jgi:hypothetical protein